MRPLHPLLLALAGSLACNTSPNPKLTSALETADSFDDGNDDDDEEDDDGDEQGETTRTSEPTAPTTGDGPTTQTSATTPGSAGTDGETSDATSDATSVGEVTSVGDDTGDTLPPDDTGTDDTGPVRCDPPDHSACDNGTQDLIKAMGLGCVGEVSTQSSKAGATGSFGVRSTFGMAGTYATREGSQYAVLSNGLVADLNLETPPADMDQGPTNCNDDTVGGADPGLSLPAPLKTDTVAGDCVQNPALVGTGDCSSSIDAQFTQGGSAFDYTELRVTVEVPADVTAFSYDVAFFSAEYPYYFGTQFSDMYVAWLESEKWTGNVTFDASAAPLSLASAFLTLKDDAGTLPAFDGTCMRQHAGTEWLTTTAGVTPGETITLVFAVFDMADAIVDSFVFLDNFRWSCAAGIEPSTKPAG